MLAGWHVATNAHQIKRIFSPGQCKQKTFMFVSLLSTAEKFAGFLHFLLLFIIILH